MGAANHRPVLESRWKLFTAALAAIQGSYQNAKMFEKEIAALRTRLDDLDTSRPEQQEPIMRWLWNLQHQGHRSWLSFLASLPLDVGPSSELAERIFGTPHNLIRLYITKLRKKYSQRQGHFPNVFLNDAVVLPDEAYRAAHVAHVHTYWLKYLILRFLHLNPERLPKGRISSESLIAYFTGELGYEETLVRLAVGSLSDPSTSVCISIVKPDRIERHIEILELSPRGRMLVRPEQPLCFNFDYLQLVTDDYLLALPKVIAHQIFVDADLGHTLKAGPQYVRDAREALRLKIPAMLHFFKVLRTSFFEEASYRGTLDVLEEASLVPEFKRIEVELLDSVSRVAVRFDSNFRGEDLPDYREMWRAIDKDQAVNRLISDYYADPVPVFAG